MSGEEIYHNFTEAVGAGDLAEAANIARNLRAEHEQEAAEIRLLAVFMESAWQGDAGGAAQRGAAPLAVEHELSAPLLFTDYDLLGRQVGSFDDARNRVMPVPPAPERPPGMGILFQPGALPTYQRQLAEHNAAAESNVEVMMSYEDASSYNADNLPSSYGSLSPDTAEISMAPTQDAGTDPRGGDDGGSPNGGLGPDVGRGPGTPAASSSAPLGGEVPPQATTPHRFVPPSAKPAPGPIVTEPIGGGSPPTGGFVPGSRGVSGSGLAEGGPGVRPGVRAGVSGPGGNAGGRAGMGGDAGHGAGGRAGSSPVLSGAPEAAARGSAGPQARGGAGVPMGAGAARGQGSEDEDHQRKTYLEGGDPEDLYGIGEMTTPPVIGNEEE